jgi:hypothetical protein
MNSNELLTGFVLFALGIFCLAISKPLSESLPIWQQAFQLSQNTLMVRRWIFIIVGLMLGFIGVSFLVHHFFHVWLVNI